jgi:hypothetical protein
MYVKTRPFPPRVLHIEKAVNVLPRQPPEFKKYFLGDRFLYFHKKHLHRFYVVHIEEFSFSNIQIITEFMAKRVKLTTTNLYMASRLLTLDVGWEDGGKRFSLRNV